MKILVPIDGSEFSKNSIDFVTSRATLLGHNPTVELLSVQAAVPSRASNLVGSGALKTYYDEEAQIVLGPATEALKKANVNVQSRFAVGEAAPTIAQVSSLWGLMEDLLSKVYCSVLSPMRFLRSATSQSLS